MNTPNTHTQLPENLLVVDKEWLEKEIEKINGGATTATIVLQDLLTSGNSYPLTPILEDAWENGSNYDFRFKMSQDKHASFSYAKQSFLSQPIKLKRNVKWK
jgi:hypothetical protein